MNLGKLIQVIDFPERSFQTVYEKQKAGGAAECDVRIDRLSRVLNPSGAWCGLSAL